MVKISHCISCVVGTFILVLGLSGCGAAVKSNIAQAVEREPLQNPDVFILHNAINLPPESVFVGEFKIGDSGFSTQCSKEEVFDHAKTLARENQANLVILDELKEPDFNSTCYRVKGRLFYNNTTHMKDLWEVSSAVFDKNADYAYVHFICKPADDNFYKNLKRNYKDHPYTVQMNAETIPLTEYTVVTKKIYSEDALHLSASSASKKNTITLQPQNGKEYFILVYTNSNTKRLALKEYPALEGRDLKFEVLKTSDLIQENKKK